MVLSFMYVSEYKHRILICVLSMVFKQRQRRKNESNKITRGPFLNDNLYLINIGRLGRGIFFLFYNIFFSVEPKSQPKTVQLGIFYNVLSRLFTFTTVAMCLFTDFPAQSDRPDMTSEPTCNNLIVRDTGLSIFVPDSMCIVASFTVMLSFYK